MTIFPDPCCKTIATFVVVCAIAACGASARADQVVVRDVKYLDAKVVDLLDGTLRFRTADGKLRSAGIDEVDLILVDRGGLFVDFNQGERFLAAGEPARAATRYRRSLPLAADYWADLIAARLAQAYDAAGQLDQNVMMLIRLVGSDLSGAVVVARLIPERISTTPDARVTRALSYLEAALSKGPDESQRIFLSLLRYELLRHVGDKRARLAARVIAEYKLPEGLRSPRVYSIAIEAWRTVLVTDETVPASVRAAAIAALDQGILDAPDAVLPALLLLKGRVLLADAATREELIRATWPLLRIAIHFADDPAAPEGLFLAAGAVERLGQANQAIDMLQECLRHPRIEDRTRRSANAAMTTLRSRVQAGD